MLCILTARVGVKSSDGCRVCVRACILTARVVADVSMIGTKRPNPWTLSIILAWPVRDGKGLRVGVDHLGVACGGRQGGVRGAEVRKGRRGGRESGGVQRSEETVCGAARWARMRLGGEVGRQARKHRMGVSRGHRQGVRGGKRACEVQAGAHWPRAHAHPGIPR